MPTKSSRNKNCDPVPKTKKSKSEERFVRDLLIRGEATEELPDGELPPGATHKIIDKKDEDLPEIERERFSIY